MLETIAIRTVFGTIGSFLKSIPREVWYIALAIGLLLWIDGRAYDRGSASRDKEVATLNTRLEVSNASLEALIAQNAQWVEEGRIRQEEAVEAVNEARDAGDEMRRAAQEQGRTDWRGQEGL